MKPKRFSLFPDCVQALSALLALFISVMLWKRISLVQSQMAAKVLSLLLLAYGFAGIWSIFAATRATRIKFILVTFSIGVSILGVELLLASIPINPYELYAKKLGFKYDKRTPVEFMMSENAAGRIIYPRVSGANFLQSPLLINEKKTIPFSGISLADQCVKFETGQFLVYPSDEHGFHNPRGLWNSPSDFVFIGDSFTLGCSVGSESNFVARVRNRYQKSLNLGHGGNGPMLELATLKEYGIPNKPKIVFWCYYEGNDLNDLNEEKKNSLLKPYLNSFATQDLLQKQPAIDDALKNYIQQEARHSKSESRIQEIKSVLKLRNLRSRTGLMMDESVDLELFEKVLLEARSSVEGNGGKLCFIYLPCWERLSNRNVTHYSKESVERILTRIQVPCIDATKAFMQLKDPLEVFPYRLNGHYNEKGHSIVSEEILKWLKTQGY